MEVTIDSKELEYLKRKGSQRAGLMGFMTSLLETPDEGLTFKDAKIGLCNMFEKLIEHNIMVGDEIDSLTISQVLKFLEEEEAMHEAVAAAKDILNNKQ